MNSQQKKEVDIVTDTEAQIQIKVTEITNLSPNAAQETYLEMLEEYAEPSAAPAVWFGVSLAVSKLTSNPYIAIAMGAIDGLSVLGDYTKIDNIERYELALDAGQSVLVVRWEITGDPRAQKSWISYYSWDEETLPF